MVDCPHRECLGYGGDAGTSLETRMFNFVMETLYSKWTADWRAALGAVMPTPNPDYRPPAATK